MKVIATRNYEETMMIKRLAEIVDIPERDCIYDILHHMDLGLCVDIGAAAGHVTKRICLVGGPNTEVVAFEPFPGNHDYFRKSVEDLNNKIRLVKKAVSDTVGISNFCVGSVVQGSEPGWEKYVGYSSLGFLSSVSRSGYLKSKIRGMLCAAFGRPGPQVFEVETTTIDKEFPNDVIDFVKIDVQGAEADVLRGAEAALIAQRIGVLYVEWSGELEVLLILLNQGYHVYDSIYIVGPKSPDIKKFTEIGFRCLAEIGLSTGATAYEMILEDGNVSPSEAISEIGKRNLGWIHTDLIVISPKVKEAFLTAAKKYSKEKIEAASVD